MVGCARYLASQYYFGDLANIGVVIMPAFNFMKQFADDVESGKKLQTIRAVRKDKRLPCDVGDDITLYTGQRTKGCRKLGIGKCTGVTPILILNGKHGPELFIACAMILNEDDFAEADGFDNSVEFYKFFEDTHGLPFRGWLIEWELLP